MALTCPKGTYVDCKSLVYGAIAKDVPSKDYCTTKAIFADPFNKGKNFVNCSANLDKAFINSIAKDCPKFDAKSNDLNNARVM